MTWLPFVVLALLVVTGFYFWARASGREALDRDRAEYERVFGGCYTCGHDRFSRQEWGRFDRTPHFCREKGRWTE